MKNRYLKYQIKYNLITDILNKLNKKKVNFFIDLLSICKGLYNKDNIFYELNYYTEHGQPSFSIINELRGFLNNLFKIYKQYDPFMVIFYDQGKNSQNTSVDPTYKQGRSHYTVLLDDETEAYKQIKQCYYIEIENYFNQERLQEYCKVFYLKQYESDLIPYYCLKHNLFDSQDNQVLNVILSLDKDLLQCCKFTNTIMCATRFIPTKERSKQIDFGIYDSNNAIEYIYSNFKYGILTAEHIPLILSIMGDKADNIPGIKGYGPKKAIEKIQNYNIPTTLSGLKINKDSLPKDLKDNFGIIEKNMKLIDFEEQLKRTKILM